MARGNSKNGVYEEGMSIGRQPSKSKVDETVELDISEAVNPSGGDSKRKRAKREDMKKMKDKKKDGK